MHLSRSFSQTKRAFNRRLMRISHHQHEQAKTVGLVRVGGVN